jgi:S-adenosylmethionine:diacylglycerol 3-amino-3-carboxypropyl transferase
MYEDPAIELGVLPPGRIFCVAGAGCTAFELARRGDHVIAVDVNPAQAAYVQARLNGSPPREGKVEGLLARARALAPLLGWRGLHRFCALDDVGEQERIWREELDTLRFRVALALLLRPWALRRVYAEAFAAAVPRPFDRVLRRRLERGFRLHPNRRNPYAAQLLLGIGAGTSPPPAADVEVVCADASEYLETCPRGSFDGFALSNVLDGAGEPYGHRLFRAVRRAGAPAAVFVLRSLGEPARSDEGEWAMRDRSFLWGSVRVESAGDG